MLSPRYSIYKKGIYEQRDVKLCFIIRGNEVAKFKRAADKTSVQRLSIMSAKHFWRLARQRNEKKLEWRMSDEKNDEKM